MNQGSSAGELVIDGGRTADATSVRVPVPQPRRREMLLVREIMFCKPGKVRSLVDKFLAMSKLMDKQGMGKMRVMTDLSAERYWTVVAEMDVADLGAFERMLQGQGQSEADQKEFERIMQGYHELVDHGRREIYRIEGP
jgi:hypothetical protein